MRVSTCQHVDMLKSDCYLSWMLIATTNSKGGVGKSTIAVHLAAWLHRQGKRVSVIDCDTQQSCSRWLHRVNVEIPTVQMGTPEEVFKYALEFMLESELVIADGPAGLAELTRALLMVCDLASVPCGASALDLESSRITVEVIKQARKIRKGDLPMALFIPNRLQTNTLLANELLAVSSRLGIPVTQTSLRLRQIYANAPGQGQVVWNIPNAPGEAVADMELLCQEIISYAESKTEIS
jgi:chromosome partitioning protein